MKKQLTLAAVATWALILAGCTNNSNVENSNTNVQNSQNSSQWTSVEIKPQTNLQVIDMSTTYEIGWNKVPLAWKINLENWIVKSVEISNPQWVVQKFADWINEKVVWKALSGLQVDTVSWASYVTKWFNDYLNTINK